MRLGTGPVGTLIGLAVMVGGCQGDGITGPLTTTPTITRVEPATGTVGTELTITGAGFRDGAEVFVGTLAAGSVEVASAATIYALVPAGVRAGQLYAVRVRNSDGTAAELAGAFTAVAPLLRYVNGATQPSGTIGSTVVLEGRAFGDRQGQGEVRFADGAGGSIAARITTPRDWTDSFIVTVVPSGAATGDLVISTATGSDTMAFTVPSAAAFSPSTVTWTSTTALPVGLSGHDAVFAHVGSTNLVYVTGGAAGDHVPRAAVAYATVQASGGLGASWTTTTSLPAARAFHASVVATAANSRVLGDSASLYVLGGTSDTAETPTTTVYRGRLNADGSVRDWITTASLPVPLHSLGAVIIRGELYVAGGATTNDSPVSTVYRARIDPTGNLQAWRALPALPAGRAYHGFVAVGGYLYAFGGESGTQPPHGSTITTTSTAGIVYARIDLRTGGLADSVWTVNAASMIKPVSKHSTLEAGGTAFVTGGLYVGASTGSTENMHAPFSPDGGVGSFSLATGANTIQSSGGGNLFNHAAVSYVDANGVARVIILGGDDLNTPGAKRAGVWFY